MLGATTKTPEPRQADAAQWSVAQWRRLPLSIYCPHQMLPKQYGWLYKVLRGLVKMGCFVFIHNPLFQDPELSPWKYAWGTCDWPWGTCSKYSAPTIKVCNWAKLVPLDSPPLSPSGEARWFLILKEGTLRAGIPFHLPFWPRVKIRSERKAIGETL